MGRRPTISCYAGVPAANTALTEADKIVAEFDSANKDR